LCKSRAKWLVVSGQILSPKINLPSHRGLNQPSEAHAGQPKGPNKVVKKEERRGKRKEPAVCRRWDQETNGEKAKLAGAGVQEPGGEKEIPKNLKGRMRGVKGPPFTRLSRREKGADRRVEKRRASGEAGLDGPLPSQPLGLLFHVLPINGVSGAESVKVDKPFERKRAVPGGMHRQVQKFPVRA
jgi:hypothetical protein